MILYRLQGALPALTPSNFCQLIPGQRPHTEACVWNYLHPVQNAQ